MALIDDILQALASTLPDSNVNLVVAYPGFGGSVPSFLDVTVTNGNFLNGLYDSYCIDVNTGIVPGRVYQAKVYSSYNDPLPNGIIDKPQNLDEINWLLNQNFVGKQSSGGLGAYTLGDQQLAIWTLLDNTIDPLAIPSVGPYNQNRVNEIVNASLQNGAGFVPGISQSGIPQDIGIILIPVDQTGSNIAQATISILKTAALGDFVWEDSNGNGIQDANENGVQGVTVTLTGGGKDGVIGTADDTTVSTTTDANGAYLFPLLLPGVQYKVTFSNLPTGFVFTAPNQGSDITKDSNANPLTGMSQTITLNPHEFNRTIDGGIFKPASLAGFVYVDANNNGIKDAGEAAIVGTTITLTGTDNLGNLVTLSATTAADGSYQFTTLRPGTYTVTETQPTGFLDGKDTIGSPGGTTGNDQFSNVVLTSGTNGVNNNFGELTPASLAGFVYVDADNDGVKDAGEAAIVGTTITLTGTDDLGNPVTTTATTAADGSYKFNNLRPGTYTVTETQPTGFLDGKDTIGSPGGTTGNDQFSNVVLTSGTDGVNNNFGELIPASLAGFVYVDADNDGVKDAGEAAIVGTTITLTGTDDLGNPVTTTATTAADGSYQFTTLRPGTYTVTETQPTGFLDGKDTIGSPGGTTGNDQFSNVVLTSGTNGVNNNFGELIPASLGNFVFEDKNANGIQDAGEIGIAGASVNLLDAAGNFITSTTTDGSGLYSFNNLQPGDYKVQFVQPNDFNSVSPVNVGGDDSVDSDGLVSDVVNLSPGENDTTVDAGFYNTAALGDYVFVDANNNGIQDASEAGLGNVKVELINPADGSVITSITTDANGGYNFSGLTPGNYQVKFIAPTGYSFSTANQGGDDGLDSDANTTTGKTQTITLTSGEFNGTLDAGLVPLANLGNFVFEDKNANGIQDAGETGIGNATVNLLDAAGNFITSTTTDSSGLYSFNNLQPGDYKVQFVQPTGFNGVSPANVGGDDSVDSDGLVSDVVNLSPGENNTTVDSGFYNTAALGDFVFNDANNNGIQDTGEAGIGGVTVQLINPADGSVIGTTTTTTNGGYQFSGLIPGDYQVKFIAPTGYSFTKANQGTDDGKDSDANPSTGVTQTVTLTSGELNGTLDAGLVPLASLGNFVFEDKNANGIQDAGEIGIAGASVNLLDAAGNFITTTTTDGDGLYSFTNLQPGDYKVQFVQPTGFNGVSPANVGGDDSVDSDGLVSDVVNLSPGENNTTVDSGFYNTAALGDFVFNDANNNGIQDTGEAGIGGVTVQLINPADGSVITSTTTDGNGGYNFSGLTPGNYQVKFIAPAGYNFSTPDQGGDDTKDSDANTITGKTQTVTLTSGELNGTLDAGLVPLASLGNFVFEDKNANGIQDAGEIGIAGASVNLLDAAGNFITTTTTDGDGLYSFTNLQPGDYKVQFVQPTGFNGVSPANVGGDDSVDSDGLVSDVVNLSPGENDTTVDSGFYKTASLGDFVFNDANNNGIQDTGEAGIGEVTVQLINPADGSVITSTTTDANGGYNFSGLTPGNYQVKFIAPAGYSFSIPDQGGDDTKDSDANTITGKTQTVTLTSGELNGTLDAGLVPLASLGNFVFEDKNANGIQDAGEIGIAGASVNLLDAAGNFITTTTTNGSGLYSFTNLQPGDYKVQFVQPTGFNGVSPVNVGANDAVDSDGLISDVVNLSPGENDTTVDSGFYKTASLGDRVWLDSNLNGIQDTGEAGVSGVTVTLTGAGADGVINTADDTTATTTTNASGNYNFTNLNPGEQYQVTFSRPAGYNFTQKDVNGNSQDTIDSDADLTTGKSQIVTLTSGENNPTIDAGIYQAASDLSITKTDGLTTVTPGQQITYTIVAQNNGLVTATNALVSDIMPSNLTNITWTSVASGGATGNDLTGTGNINDYVTLASGSSITYTVKGTVAASTTTLGSAATFDLSGNSALDGTDGNTRTFTANGINVTASAFSRVDGTNGAWSPAYLGSYGGGLGVTDNSTAENGGLNNTHTVDNMGGRDNYVLFQFSESVVLNRANLGYVVGDSDISVWIGNFNSPITALSDSVLNSFGFTEVNDTTLTTARWADVNAGNYAGNTIVIAASTADTTLNDQFKILNLDVNKVVSTTSSLINTATVTAPNGFTDTNLSNNSATDTDIIGVPTVKIGDRVWYDTNGNGVQDTGELGVAGVSVKLLNQAGTQVGTTTTDTNGLYQFTTNANSTYSVQFVQPTGFNGFTTADIGNDAADSDVVDAATGKTATFAVGTTDNFTIDAGLIKNNVDLSITKTDGLTTVSAGQQITYTIVVGNNGPMTATNALVSDVIPTNLTNVTWTSVASSGATGNDLTGTGNINDYVTLASGSSITYTLKGTVAANTTTLGNAAEFDFAGNSALDGTDGNTRTFTANGINVTARVFSRVDGTNGAWSPAYLGSYGGGLGVTDSGETTSDHRVDNIGGRDNYVLFQFSESVVLDQAYLQYVVNDSDISVWIGNFGSPITSLSDSVLNSFGFTEVNDTTLTTDRWANVNAGNYAGNTIVIAASAVDTTPEDQFKIRYLDVNKVVQGTSSLSNTATVTAPTGFTDTNLSNNSATDTDIIGVPTVKIGDRVWYDTNGNGVQDTGESGVSGVAVKLFNQAGTQVGTTTTDTNGLYQFSVSTNSTYSVQFVQPTGFDGFTTANVGNDAADSDVVNTNGTTAQFSVATSDNLTIDAGLIKNIGDLSITKTDGLTTVTPGQNITYTIVVNNNGLMTATNALVSDVIPSLLTNVTWSSVAAGGATGNETSGTGSINDYVTLTAGSSITYTVNATVSSNAFSTGSIGSLTTFDLSTNPGSALDGTDGNTRTFTKDGISVTARAFSRVDGTNGAWSSAYLGSYTGGLGVTDSGEGNGNDTHRVDNVGGRDNYVLFQFSESVVLDRAYLQYVVNDSDASVWIGNFNSQITSLSDSTLNSFGFKEVNETTLTTDRWADLNAGNYVGNTIVIAASAVDTTPEDEFKIRYLDVQKYVAPTTVSLTNTATVTAPTGFTDTNSNNNSATDTDTINNTPTLPCAPGTRTPGFWRNTEWQKFWDGIAGNEPSQAGTANFPKSDLLFSPYTNSAQPGKVLDPLTGQYDVGLLIGDYNRNGKTDAGEKTLFYTRAQALQIVDSSAQPDKKDKRYDLGRSLVASWLNYLAANPIDTANTSDKDTRYYINEGIDWLQALTPDENGDKKGDGALNKLTGSTVNSPAIESSSSYWNSGISSASGLPSPYNSNTNVLYPLEAGSVINTALDNYNNSGFGADGGFYGG